MSNNEIEVQNISSYLELLNQLRINLGANSNRSQARELEKEERKNQIAKQD
jgi:hypothetical protein